MLATPTLLFSLLWASASVVATPCVVFDANWNLYAFGVQGQNDWNLATQDTWALGSGGNVTTVAKTNAPPFNGANTQCFLAEFFNVIYVLDGDSSNAMAVHIFDASSQTWTVQSVSSGGIDPTTVVAILDHDTNVLFGMSGGTLYQLDMGTQTQATSGSLSWDSVGTPSFTTTGYTPVMGHADNHIYFLDVPGSNAGDAYIFVIHYSFFQPDPQSYTGSPFPVAGGKTTSIFMPASVGSVPQEFAFFPNDGSDTYIVDVVTNTTTTMKFPTSAPSAGAAYYAGSPTAIVQLAPSGQLYYAVVDATDASKTASNTWAAIPNSLFSASGSSSTASSTGTVTGTATGSGAHTTGMGTASSTSTSSTSSKSSAMKGLRADERATMGVLAALGGVAAGMLFL